MSDINQLSNEDLMEAFGKHYELESNGKVEADYIAHWDELYARLDHCHPPADTPTPRPDDERRCNKFGFSDANQISLMGYSMNPFPLDQVCPDPPDDVDVDDIVADLLTTIMRDKVNEWLGDYADLQMIKEIIAQFRHDLASQGLAIVEVTP